MFASVRNTVRPACAARTRLTARAESEQAGTVFHGGNTYTEDEWQTAKQTGNFKPAPPSTSAPEPDTPPSIGSLMAFDGPAPELINSRLAMLGFVAALGAEASTGENIFSQIGEAPGPIFLTFVTIAIASLLPLASNKSPEQEATGPFTLKAELWNGRAAMLGIVALGVTELVKGSLLG